MFTNLAPEQMNRIGERLRLDMNLAKAAPLEKTVLVAGDWNFCNGSETGFAADSAPDQFAASAAAPVGQMAVRWQLLLLELTNAHCSRLTHWSAQANAASRLDRV